MSYSSLSQKLINIFENNNYSDLVLNNNYHSEEIICSNNSGLNIVLKYPGKRSKIINGRLNNYDYKLLLNGNPPVHNFIINDLYNKSLNYPNLRNILVDFLIDLARNGNDVNLSKYKRLDEISIGYTKENLKTLIPILVLQEDFNFPRPCKGRTLTFHRYIEAIFAADEENNYTLSEVENRTNNHGGRVPNPWPEYINYYNQIDQVNRP